MLAEEDLELSNCQRAFSERQDQIANSRKTTHVCELFSDAVRRTLAYRLYVRLIRPLKKAKAIPKL